CPALLTKMSTLPNSALACLHAASIGPAFDTSQLIATTLPLPPIAWIAALASLRLAWSRARIATSAPEAAYSLAIARPRPLLPPVIMALLPSSRTSIVCFLRVLTQILSLFPRKRDSGAVVPFWSLDPGLRGGDEIK